MANFYRVVYVANGPEHQKSISVSATTPANAVTAVKTADRFYKEVVSVTQRAESILTGS